MWPPYGGGVTGSVDATDDVPDGGARSPVPSGPAVLMMHNPRWATLAAERLTVLGHALTPLVDVDASAFDHIGSTAVAGLAAKASVDLQVRVPVLPEPTAMDAALARLGWTPAPGSRADSPGVDRDSPAPGDTEPDWVWAKRLYTSTDPARPARAADGIAVRTAHRCLPRPAAVRAGPAHRLRAAQTRAARRPRR